MRLLTQEETSKFFAASKSLLDCANKLQKQKIESVRSNNVSLECATAVLHENSKKFQNFTKLIVNSYPLLVTDDDLKQAYDSLNQVKKDIEEYYGVTINLIED